MNKPFKILCIDGGGIKGVFSAQVLSVFEEAFDTTVSEHFDLVCGTSTGGIIALGVAAGIPMKTIVEFYTDYGPQIFSQRWKTIFGEWVLKVKQAIIKSKYSDKSLRSALESVFGDKKIGSSQNLLCIPAFNITDFKPRIFKKDYGDLNKDDEKTFVDVALATTAAPTYFPIHEIDDVQYVDGGLYANNPLIVGLTECVFNKYWIKPKSERSEDDYDGVQILSISSCEMSSGVMARRKEQSFINWLSTLFDAYGEGQSKLNSYFISQIKNHLDFEIEIERVTNELLSAEQSKIIALDKAGVDSLKLLRAKGKTAGNNAKNLLLVKKLFMGNKTIDTSKI